MAGSRAAARDVFFYDLRDPPTVLGGLVLTHGITNANFYSMTNIVLRLSSDYFLQTNSGETLPKDSRPLLPGHYFIVTDGTVQVSDTPAITRTASISTGSRLQTFKKQVRERDGRCVVTKTENRKAIADNWRGFHAAHILPLSHERYWIDNDFSRWISLPLPPSQGGSINSVQNGLLLRNDIHEQFVGFDFSIDPDVSFPFVAILRV